MNYYIIGSGGFAKEVYFLADESLPETHVFKGFIDKTPETDTILVRGRNEPVIAEDTFLEQFKGQAIALFIGLGDPKIIRKIGEKYEKFEFPNLIHPNLVYDSRSVSLGKGNIITSGCNFTVDIEIGDFNIFNLDSTLGHDCVIGNFNVFNPGTQVSGGVKIGDANLFGTNCAILQYMEVGSGSILGAGGLLTKSLASNTLAVGVPASFRSLG